MPRLPTEHISARVADRLRTLRRDRSLTQAQLAEEAGLAVETLSRIEQQRELPSLRTLDRLAGVLEVSVDVLVRTTGPPPPPRPDSKTLSAEARQLLRLVQDLDRQAVRHLLALARMLVQARSERPATPRSAKHRAPRPGPARAKRRGR